MNSQLARRLATELVSKIDIFVSCHNLLDKDTFSKSDPCCVLHLQLDRQWIEIGRTETIMNNLNPQFSKNFCIDYYFEEVQLARFSVYDIDNTTPQLDDDDFLGYTECTIGELVSNSPMTLPLLMKNGSRAGNGTIVLRAFEQTRQKDLMLVQFTGQQLDKKDFFGKSDPYLEFSKRLPTGGYHVVHRTEYIKSTLDPMWKPFEIGTSKLCDGDYEAPIKVECYDWNASGSPDFIGSFETKVSEMMSVSKINGKVSWPCINPKKKAKKSSYKSSGTINLLSCTVSTQYSFLDFVFGGLQLKFCVAVDFTASNGDPRSPDSLHFFSPAAPNHYVRAIKSVGGIIKDYDRDQLFPCFGFGARVPPTMEVSHCFPLSFVPENPHCFGIQGILDAYHNSLNYVQLLGPTNFSPVVNFVSQLASGAQRLPPSEPLLYYVLLIITDGVISDMSNTVRAIVQSSSLPMSIIIVGVGGADFEAMDRLDSDDQLLRDQSGNVARRDIVQFVPFRNFERASQAALAKQVLAELPDQVVMYYKNNNIKPGEPKSDAQPPNIAEHLHHLDHHGNYAPPSSVAQPAPHVSMPPEPCPPYGPSSAQAAGAPPPYTPYGAPPPAQYCPYPSYPQQVSRPY